jgi:hypothetical protein
MSSSGRFRDAEGAGGDTTTWVKVGKVDDHWRPVVREALSRLEPIHNRSEHGYESDSNEPEHRCKPP